LRTSFRWFGVRDPLQVVHKAATIPVTHGDWTRLDVGDVPGRW